MPAVQSHGAHLLSQLVLVFRGRFLQLCDLALLLLDQGAEVPHTVVLGHLILGNLQPAKGI